MLQRLPRGVGRVLKRARPGPRKLAVNEPAFQGTPCTLNVRSDAFGPGSSMPQRYTSDGEGVSPPIAWSGVPEEAKALVLMVEDADSPTFAPLVHAIVWELAPQDGVLKESALTESREPDWSWGRNSYLRTGYIAPDPPPGHGPHRYAFQVFALDREQPFLRRPGRRALLDSMEGHVLAKGCLIALYERA